MHSPEHGAVGRLPITNSDELDRILRNIHAFESGHESLGALFAEDDSERAELAPMENAPLVVEGASAGVFSATGWSNHVDTDALRTTFTEPPRMRQRNSTGSTRCSAILRCGFGSPGKPLNRSQHQRETHATSTTRLGQVERSARAAPAAKSARRAVDRAPLERGCGSSVSCW